MSFKDVKAPRKGKILVVDDDSDFVEIEKKILESESYEVLVAYNGKECIEMIGQERPDLILLDIAMETGFAGLDTAQFLRQRKETGDIPIIVVTARPIGTIYPDDAWYPTDDFVSKPVDKYELLQKVERALKQVSE